MSHRIARSLLIILCLAISSTPAFAKKNKNDDDDDRKTFKHSRIDKANKSGEIRGVFERCGPNGSSGVFVYVVGRSFSALLPSDGKFTLSYVPQGTYTLAFVQNNNVITTLDGVEVRKKRLTDVGTLAFCPDADDDGFDESVDCNDNNPTVFPGAAETCDGLDNDCNGAVDDVPGGCIDCTDADQDGFFAQELCGTAVDCDDNNSTVNPNAAEVCDGKDNNCDGLVDEGFDVDQDGITTCGGDCNDDDPNTFPGADEICGDALDNNCDGEIDEGCGGRACTDGEIAAVEACVESCQGNVQCIQSCTIDDSIVSQQCSQALLSLAICALNNDCDTSGQDLLGSSFCAFQNCPDEWQAVFGDQVPECPAGQTDCNGQCVDLNSDPNNCGQCGSACDFNEVCQGGLCEAICPQGQIECGTGCVDITTDNSHCGGCGNQCGQLETCQQGLCVQTAECIDGDSRPCGDSPNIGECRQGVQTCQGGQWGQCVGEVTPSPEVCDGLDNNCDGTTDDGNPEGGAVCDTGAPGVCGAGVETCFQAQLVCQQLQGPSAEICDGLDNNCDGQVDEENVCGDVCTPGTSCEAPDLCSTGTCDAGGNCVITPVDCVSTEPCLVSFCDPSSGACVSAPAQDGSACEGGLCFNGICVVDLDNDGFDSTIDCDDNNPSINPGADEVCDGLDNDCNGAIDDGIACSGDCVPPSTSCGNACVDIFTDADNCGACGNSCGPGFCQGGVCQQPF